MADKAADQELAPSIQEVVQFGELRRSITLAGKPFLAIRIQPEQIIAMRHYFKEAGIKTSADLGQPGEAYRLAVKTVQITTWFTDPSGGLAFPGENGFVTLTTAPKDELIALAKELAEFNGLFNG